MNVNVVLREEALPECPSCVAFDRTQVSAACIDSCITWPICPVMVKPPLPFIVLASMNRMSPPVGVHAKPDRHACALCALGNFAFGADLDAAQKFLNDFRRDDQLFRLAFGQAARLLAADRADVALQVANAGFARVVADHMPIASSGNSICSGVIPFSSICRGTRYWNAMWTFSSSV